MAQEHAFLSGFSGYVGASGVGNHILRTTEKMRRVSFMHENHQDLNSIRIWLIKIHPVGGHSSWRKWTHEKLGE